MFLSLPHRNAAQLWVFLKPDFKPKTPLGFTDARWRMSFFCCLAKTLYSHGCLSNRILRQKTAPQILGLIKFLFFCTSPSDFRIHQSYVSGSDIRGGRSNRVRKSDGNGFASETTCKKGMPRISRYGVQNNFNHFSFILVFSVIFDFRLRVILIILVLSFIFPSFLVFCFILVFSFILISSRRLVLGFSFIFEFLFSYHSFLIFIFESTGNRGRMAVARHIRIS